MLSNIVLSEEIIMSCKYNYEYTYVFKYSNPIVGKKKVYERFQHEWEEYCTESTFKDDLFFDNNGNFLVYDLKKTFKDKTLICEWKEKKVISSNNFVQNKTTLDFLLLSAHFQIYNSKEAPIKCEKLN